MKNIKHIALLALTTLSTTAMELNSYLKVSIKTPQPQAPKVKQPTSLLDLSIAEAARQSHENPAIALKLPLDLREAIKKYRYDQEETLMKAARDGDLKLTKKLLAEGVDINAKRHGYTALMHAALELNPEIVNELLQNNASVDLQHDQEGQTALILALLPATPMNKEGRPIPMNKGRIRRVSIVKMLLKNHASLDLQDNKGWTALMHAASKGFLTDIARELLNNGASVTIKNKRGQTAADLAIDEEIKKMICEKMGTCTVM